MDVRNYKVRYEVPPTRSIYTMQVREYPRISSQADQEALANTISRQYYDGRKVCILRLEEFWGLGGASYSLMVS